MFEQAAWSRAAKTFTGITGPHALKQTVNASWADFEQFASQLCIQSPMFLLVEGQPKRQRRLEPFGAHLLRGQPDLLECLQHLGVVLGTWSGFLYALSWLTTQ